MTQPPLLIFGAGEYAHVAHYYFTRDGGRRVSAFVVDDAYVEQAPAGPAPVVAWSEALAKFPAASHECFVAIGYSRLNRTRVEKASVVSAAGYRLASLLHSRAISWDGFELQDNCL